MPKKQVVTWDDSLIQNMQVLNRKKNDPKMLHYILYCLPIPENQLIEIDVLIEDHFKQYYKMSPWNIKLNLDPRYRKSSLLIVKILKMFIDGKYNFVCIAPREWKIHKQEELETMIVKSCISHRQKTTCIHGAVVNISPISTKLEYYNLKLWFRKEGDKSSGPNSKSYFGMLLKDF